jgi:DNA-binding response OmpR family regulator
MHIVVVEDEKRLAQALKDGLEIEGYTADAVLDGESALSMLIEEKRPCDAIILDLMLPRKSGLEVCQELRSEGITTPVLILTALDTLQEKITALDGGADDFISKPFAFDELLARLRALLRRCKLDSLNRLVVGDLVLDLGTREVFRGEELIPLTHREFDMLVYLMNAYPRVVSREELLREVWRIKNVTVSNVVDARVRNMRNKIEKPDGEPLIRTVRGVGYAIYRRP